MEIIFICTTKLVSKLYSPVELQHINSQQWFIPAAVTTFHFQTDHQDITHFNYSTLEVCFP